LDFVLGNELGQFLRIFQFDVNLLPFAQKKPLKLVKVSFFLPQMPYF